jgi:hypothetical protein
VGDGEDQRQAQRARASPIAPDQRLWQVDHDGFSELGAGH